MTAPVRRRRCCFGGAAFLLIWAAIAACAPGGTEATARTRGDLAFALDSFELALAEYRLAVKQGSDGAETLARLAHTYVRVGRVEQARSAYQSAAEKDEDFVDQAAADFLHMALEAARRGERFQMAAAMDAALGFRPGITVRGIALPLARHYVENGEFGRALPFFQEALAQAPDSAPELVFEIGRAHEEIGDCQRGIVFFERFREMVEPWERSEVDWYIGTCSFRLASDLSEGVRDSQGRRSLSPEESQTLEEALVLLDRTLEVGEPRNVQGPAWFERGEVLFRLGDCEGAELSFREVPRAEPSPNTERSRRSQERADRIRFGRGPRELRSEQGCG